LLAVAIATPLAHVVLRMNTAILVRDAIGMGFFATSDAAIAVDAGATWFAVGSTVATLLRLAALALRWRLPTGPRALIARAE
jgi:uncharacterized membrane protein YeiH